VAAAVAAVAVAVAAAVDEETAGADLVPERFPSWPTVSGKFTVTIPESGASKIVIVKSPGFSLLEVLIAVSIFVGAGLGLIQVMRQGGMRNEGFSAGHYSAMFVAQKVFEDINSRVGENPHFFQELVKKQFDGKASVVDGQSPFFRLLDNTSNLNLLDPTEDAPLTKDSGSIYLQLKNYDCEVLTAPGWDPKTGNPVPNLLEVNVIITWKEPGSTQEQDYRLSQMIHGFDPACFADSPYKLMQGIPPDIVGKTLWLTFASQTMPASATFDAFMQQNQGDRDAVLAVGNILTALSRADDTNEKVNAAIASLTSQRDLALVSTNPLEKIRAADFQKRIADLFAQKASFQMAAFAPVLGALDKLESKNIDAPTLGTKLMGGADELAARIWKASWINLRIAYDFQAANAVYFSLLKAPYKDLIPERKIVPSLRTMVELQKVAILLNQGEYDLPKRVSELKSLLNFLSDQFRGRQPYFIDYLNTEYQICSTPDTIENYFGGLNGFAGALEGVRDCGDDLRNLYMNIP